MFDFFKRFFKKEKVSIKKIELEKFIDENIQAHEESIIKLQKTYKGQIAELKGEVNEKCKTLEDAKLRNENIPKKAISIMNGNRSAFIRSAKLLIDQVSNHVSDNTDIIKTDIHDIQSLLDVYNKSTKKSYFVLQEFFANESGDIAKSIKKLDVVNKEFIRELKDSKYFRFMSVKELLDNKKKKENRIKELQKINKNRQKDLEDAKQGLENIKAEIKSVRESKEFKKLKSLSIQLEENKANQKRLTDEIYHMFLPLSRAMRKYAKISIDSGISSEIEYDIVKAIKKHSPSEIRSALDGMKRSIESGSLNLKENVKEKNLIILTNVSMDWLSEHKKNLDETNNKMNNLQQEIDNSDLHKELKMLEEKTDKKKEEINDIQKDVIAVQSEISKSKSDNFDGKIIKHLKEMDIELE
jgi:hypothetical protein